MISVFDLFSIGIGPSSSHTVGPMKAANKFVSKLINTHLIEKSNRIQIELYGSLAHTGIGHRTDHAILMGLCGELPETIDPDTISSRVQQIKNHQEISLQNQHSIHFDIAKDLVFYYQDLLPLHTNGMRFSAFTGEQLVLSEDYYSIGGGFIIQEIAPDITESTCPYPFDSGKTLLAQCQQHQLTIPALMWANETAIARVVDIKAQLLLISKTMGCCIQKGCVTEGILPGGLNVRRRAPFLYEKLKSRGKPHSFEQTDSLNWLNLYAIAVNEENAAGGRVVTAPTNGAAGILPAVLHYYLNFYPQAKPLDAIDFLLTAGAIAILYKKKASISGAEVGCQGEVGVASSMAAAGLTFLLGGTLEQIENAAEIAMEHHLGLTCDPIKGLVQIPCIERNAMGAVKAVNAARLALLGDGHHHVSLDKVIATMRQTGRDMMTIYKETSLGGLAASLPEC